MNDFALPVALDARSNDVQTSLYVQPVVLAGGSGTRLWPLSREHCPKQLIDLLAGESLLEATLRRLDGVYAAAGGHEPDTVGKAYANKSDLDTALKAWQDALSSYGQQQGFTVSAG